LGVKWGMGQYKVPQNVEAEDKILGPLTFKEFIYFLIGVGWAIVCFGVFRTVPAIMILVALPPTTLMLLLAFYNRDGQKFEQLLLAMVQFFAASRRRAWNKNDAIETFHVEPTAHAAELTQRNSTDVRGELEKLANLIDSRGWNHPQELPGAEPSLVLPATAHTDRIVPPAPAVATAEEVPTDILDLKESPLAQNLAALLQAAAEDVREEALEQMSGRAAKPASAGPAPTSTSSVTAAPASDILKLATQSDELTVSQIAAQATRRVQLPNGEVVEVPVNGS
jgi:PrgI family protein